MSYILQLNLQKSAALRFARSFWEKKDVKDRVTRFFESCYEIDSGKIRSEWCELRKVVLDEWEKDLLPQKLDAVLFYTVKMIGDAIFQWFDYIKNRYKAKEEAINCIDKIHWTPYGTVDAVQTFKSSWLDNPYLEITKVYEFACDHALEEYIDDLWNKIPEDVRNNQFIYKDFLPYQHILAYWKFRRNNELPSLIEYLESRLLLLNAITTALFNITYDVNSSIEENMLWLSVHEGYFNSMEYFWNKLTEEQRDKCVVKCARIVVKRFSDIDEDDEGNLGHYTKNPSAKLLIFFMNQMSAIQKRAFFNENLRWNDFSLQYDYYPKDNILNMLLGAWPWQEFFIPVLKDILQYQNNDSEIDWIFICTITNRIVEDHKLGISLENNIYRHLLREAWLIIPASMKQKMKFNHYMQQDFIPKLGLVWDIDSLRLILNDPALGDIRDTFIELGSYTCEELIVNDQFDKLDYFIQEIFRTEEERKLFRQKIKVWCQLISEGQFPLVEKVLDWQSSSPEERQFIKNNIDYMTICKDVIQKEEYDLADKYLDWQFDTEEKKKICKDHFKNDIFSSRRTRDIWIAYHEDVNKAMEKCSEFLHWFLESEEEIALFKKEIEEKLNNDIFSFTPLFNHQYPGIINIFYSWCLLDDKQFKQVQCME